MARIEWGVTYGKPFMITQIQIQIDTATNQQKVTIGVEELVDVRVASDGVMEWYEDGTWHRV